jgi:hypothetical protein
MEPQRVTSRRLCPASPKEVTGSRYGWQTQRAMKLETQRGSVIEKRSRMVQRFTKHPPRERSEATPPSRDSRIPIPASPVTHSRFLGASAAVRFHVGKSSYTELGLASRSNLQPSTNFSSFLRSLNSSRRNVLKSFQDAAASSDMRRELVQFVVPELESLLSARQSGITDRLSQLVLVLRVPF